MTLETVMKKIEHYERYESGLEYSIEEKELVIQFPAEISEREKVEIQKLINNLHDYYRNNLSFYRKLAEIMRLQDEKSAEKVSRETN